MRRSAYVKDRTATAFLLAPGSLIEMDRSGWGKQCAYLRIEMAKGYWQSVCSHWMKSQDFPPHGLNRSLCQKVRERATINQLLSFDIFCNKILGDATIQYTP